MAEGIESAVSEKVAAQLEARKRSIGKVSNKTNEDLLYQNSKTAWIKLSSGVNTLSDEEVAKLKAQQGRTTINGSNTLAGYNILMGGVLAPDRGLRQGIEDQTGAIKGQSSDKYAYQNRIGSTGIRPMPGITSMNVKSKNTYGTLREAEVAFTCWTLEDFEIMERIYLRPGFTMLLEWGHTMYIDNDGKLHKDIESIGNRFFVKGITRSQLVEDIAKIREKTSYNYEGMVGIVKNFNWSYSSNGGYECSVSIVSIGEVLESIKIIFDPQLRLGKGEMANKDTNEGTEQRKSVYHYLFSKMEKLDKPFTFSKADVIELAPTVGARLQDFQGYIVKTSIDDSVLPFYDTKTPLKYISLRTFFDIFNTSISIVDSSKPSTSIDRPIVKFNTNSAVSSEFLTSPEHFSVDPLVCVLPNKPTAVAIPPALQNVVIAARNTAAKKAQVAEDQASGSLWNTVVDYASEKVAKVEELVAIGIAVAEDQISTLEKEAMGVVPSIHDHYVYPPGGDFGQRGADILNILVPTAYIKSKIDEAIGTDGKLSKSMHDIVESMLDGINTALGGINDLSIAFREDYEGGTHFVVDRNNTPSTTTGYPVLTMAGVDSIFTNINISSKLSNEIGSQIAIAAQGSSQNYSENVDNLLNWNPNIIDRVITTKDVSDAPQEGEDNVKRDREERTEDWKSDVLAFFKAFNPGGNYNPEQPDSAKTLHAEWTVANVVQKYKTSKREPIPGLVPVELSFKTDGIGGLIVAQGFKIASGILPAIYQDKFGYIIVGLEHSIGGNNRWETSVTTQFFPIQPPTDAQVKAAGQTPLQQITNRLAAEEAAGVHSAAPLKGNPKLKQILVAAGYNPGTFEHELALAIGTKEGWISTGNGSRSYRNNNPGNLDYSSNFISLDPKVMREPGGRFARFSTAEKGAKALVEYKVKKWASGKMPATAGNSSLLPAPEKWKKGTPPTIAQFFYTYAPPNENNTEGYIKSVVATLQKNYPTIVRTAKIIDHLT